MTTCPRYLYHATPADNLEAILANGLDPDYSAFLLTSLSERDYRETISDLHGLGPGGFHSWATGRTVEAVLLRVDVRGLDLSAGGPDGADHWTCAQRITPECIELCNSVEQVEST